MCLFLPLSLVYVSCVMAPKRKNTPSQNPLRSEASTSSDPTPSHVWFCDEKSKSDFFENFSRRGVHLESQVILSDFSDTDLPIAIHSRGWESLCDVLVTCPSALIQEFYSNMHGFDYSVPLFVTRVRGKHIVVTPDILSDVCNLIFLFRTKMPWWVLFKVFQKYRLSKSTCHKLSSCKVFQEFVLG